MLFLVHGQQARPQALGTHAVAPRGAGHKAFSLQDTRPSGTEGQGHLEAPSGGFSAVGCGCFPLPTLWLKTGPETWDLKPFCDHSEVYRWHT